MEKKYYFIGIALIAFLGIFIWLYVNEFPYFSNTLHASSLVGRATIIGLLLGLAAGYRFSRSAQGDSVDQMRIWASCIIAGLLCLPLLASLSNRLGSKANVRDVVYLKEDPFFKSRSGLGKGQIIKPDGYYLVISDNESIERFKLAESYFSNLATGTNIAFPLRKGLWGYEYLDTKELIPNITGTEL